MHFCQEHHRLIFCAFLHVCSQNEARQRLTEFSQENALVTANTLFQQPERQIYTWAIPDGLYWNQIDYKVCNRRWRSKRILNLWLQSPFAVILEPKKIKSVIASTFSPSICCEVMGPHTMILIFWMLSFKPAFSLSSFTLIRTLFAFCHLSGTICISEVTDISPGNLDFSLWFIQPSSPHDVFCKLNKQGDNTQLCHTPFTVLNQ